MPGELERAGTGGPAGSGTWVRSGTRARKVGVSRSVKAKRGRFPRVELHSYPATASKEAIVPPNGELLYGLSLSAGFSSRGGGERGAVIKSAAANSFSGNEARSQWKMMSRRGWMRITCNVCLLMRWGFGDS